MNQSTIQINSGLTFGFVYDRDVYETRVMHYKHDLRNGKTLCYGRPDEPSQVIIWGYEQTLPIAQIIIPISNENEETLPIAYQYVAHTSFEDFSHASIVNEGYTGKKAFQLTNKPLAVSQFKPLDIYFPKGDYQVSFRVKGTGNVLANGQVIYTGTGNEWQWFTTTMYINHELELTGTAIIDELRVHPPTARMQTVTYTPQIGATSQTDINGVTQWFEYDKLNRTRLIKDQDGNIIQRYTYKYHNDTCIED